MVRAEGGALISDFERAGCIAIGWTEAGDLSSLQTPDDVRTILRQAYPDASPGRLTVWTGVLYKFRQAIRPGDRVVSYDPERREYLLGTVAGEYEFNRALIPEYANIRRVEWQARVSRDQLSPSTKNTLGSTLTIFEPGEAVLQELISAATVHEPAAPEVVEQVAEEEFEVIRRDTLSRSHEFIKDRILRLADDDMERLVAALLRAMGYKARVTPKGPDRGRDVVASPDGLGFQSPRIIAEVKHRSRQAVGSQELRGFVGGLREEDRGLFVSTGGFTREAKYEADRANVPVTVVDLDELASLIVEHYERFDADGRGLLPLVRVYWPASFGRGA
jgi:restriction system protein